jgi:hypothetical protein
MDTKVKEKHRNIKSAAQSRLRKEMENRWLYNNMNNKDDTVK